MAVMAGSGFAGGQALALLRGSAPSQAPHQALWRLFLARFFADKKAAGASKGGAKEDAGASSSSSLELDEERLRDPQFFGRHGVKLRAADPQAFERMRTVLGYHQLPFVKAKGHQAKPIEHVHINNLQTLHFLDLPAQHKEQLVRYKVASLNRQMLPLLERTQQVLSSFGQSESSSASSTVAGAAAAGAEQAHSITFTPNTAAADGIKERLE